ncbi:MAG: polysaccharide pyruvyl transferase family protein [Candidatus Peribacteraceae bacterium]|nr:polysaccharide pyruvyl transferase family protein [Candidatus Peribacteraceae bacterium]
MRCVLVGNYGVGNIGDEALKEYFLTEFTDIRWTVVTAAPEHDQDVPRLPLGFRSLFTPFWRTISEIRHADALIFGGGSLFTDIESVWACVIWRAYAILASWFGVPVMLSFQGAGPWKTGLGLSLAKKTYQSAAFISVRDEDSLRRLGAFTLSRKPVLSFDPAFALFASHQKKPVARRLVIIPRTNSHENFFSEVQKKLAENFTDIRILLLQPDAAERRVGERLRELSSANASVIAIMSISQLLEEIGAASDVLSQRYHGTLAAFAMGVPARSVPQEPGDKMDTLNTVMQDGTARESMLQLVRQGADGLRQAIGGVSSL